MTAPTLSVALGCAAALGSACAWALGTMLFRRVGDHASPVGMNLGKSILGAAMLGALLLASGASPMDARTFLLLGLSGVLGIALGDTFFFQALVTLGPRLTVILGALGPALTVTFAVAFLHERLGALTWLGIALTLAGVNCVILEGAHGEGERKRRMGGVGYGLLSILCMALGTVLAKVGVAETSALQGSFVRLLWGAAALTVWGAAGRSLGAWLAPFRKPQALRLILGAVSVVIFGGFWLSMVALKHIDASVATILNATEPLFILPLAAILLKEKVTVRTVLCALAAVAGVALILHGQFR